MSSEAIKELREWLADTTSPDSKMAKAILWATLKCEAFVVDDLGPWSKLDEAIRHGIIRGAVHKIREPDAPDVTAASHALWRPYRRLRSPNPTQTIPGATHGR